MSLKQHVIQASVASVILAPLLGAKTLIIFLSAILIDIDHYFDFVIVTKRFGIRDMFKYHHPEWQKGRSRYMISLFHTVEVFILLFILGYWSHYFWLVLFGFCLHFIFDLYHLYMHHAISDKAFSILEYLIRRNSLRRNNQKGYPVPDRDFWNAKD